MQGGGEARRETRHGGGGDLNGGGEGGRNTGNQGAGFQDKLPPLHQDPRLDR